MKQLIASMVWCTAIYYFIAASELTRGLRQRAPSFVLALLLCPVCAGFWIGLLSAAYVPAPWIGGGHWLERALWGGLYGMFLTPVGNAIRRQSLELGSTRGTRSIEELQRELMSTALDH
jgi:hypothetical protein